MNSANTVQVLLGSDSIKRVYMESLQEASLDIVCLAQNYQAVLGDFFDSAYAPKLYGKIPTREILADTSANRADSISKDGSKNPVKFLPAALACESDMLLSAHKAVLISFGVSAPLAVVITDSELVNSLRNQFNNLWQQLPR